MMRNVFSAKILSDIVLEAENSGLLKQGQYDVKALGVELTKRLSSLPVNNKKLIRNVLFETIKEFSLSQCLADDDDDLKSMELFGEVVSKND